MFDKKTKIVCTIGPASWDPEILEKLAVAGMDIARLNFSHGSHEEKGKTIQDVRGISMRIGKRLAVMADLQGPKIRLGKIEGEQKEGERDSKKNLKKGEIIFISTEPTGDELPIQFDLSPYLELGHRILFNDGLVAGKVLSIKGKSIEVEVLNDGYVSSHKGVNVPDTTLPGASLPPKDLADAEFALKAGVEYLAISFVQSVQDVREAKELIKKYSPQTKLVVKLEKPQAVVVLEDIVKETDVMMVARGDLAIETRAADVPLIQQEIIRLCRQYQKPVIVATQMLESMIDNPRPTRAEVSDVANAVLTEVDAVMLSGESANGKYPVETVETMADVIRTVESNPAYKKYIKINWENITAENLSLNAIISSAASLAYRIEAKYIIAVTATGRTAKWVSSFRPSSKILAIAHDELTANQLAMVWGVEALNIQSTKEEESFVSRIVSEIKKLDHVNPGDKAVMVFGSNIGSDSDANSIKIINF